MSSSVIYRDTLTEISDDSIVLKKYYFPAMRPKTVAFADVESIEMKQPTLSTGKWRFYGTGNIRTWFPLDHARNTRDTIFLLTLKHQWIRIGFTVEDSQAVRNIFRQKGLLQ